MKSHSVNKWTVRALCSLLILTSVAQNAAPPANKPTPIEPIVVPTPPSVVPAATPTSTPAAVVPEEKPAVPEPETLPGYMSDLGTDTAPALDYPENTYTAAPSGNVDSFAIQPPSPPNGITLEDAVKLALQKNADILKQLAELKRTRGVVVEVRAAILPRLTATATYNQNDPATTNSGSSFSSSSTSSEGTALFPEQTVGTTFNYLGQPTSGTTTIPSQNVPVSFSSESDSSRISSVNDRSWRLTFEVQQTLYSGGRIVASIKAAQIAQEAAFYQLRDTVDQVISDVRRGFYTVLLNRALIKVAEQSIELLQSEMTDQQNRFEAGTVPRFNVLRAEVELANARPDLIRANNNYRTSQRQLAKLIGVTWLPGETQEPYPVKGVLVFRPVTMDVIAASESAKANRAFLKVQRQNILGEVQQVVVELAGYKPTINANAGYEFQNDQSAEDFESQVSGWFFGFTGSWDLFDGFATAGRVAQARARLESARVNYDDAVLQVELEVQTAYASLVEAREVIESQQKAVQQAEESLRLARERLSAGAGTQLEVLDARVALTDAQTTAIQALADYNSAVAELDRVTAANTVYDDTFDDPLTNPKTRKYWFSKKKPVQKVKVEKAAPPPADNKALPMGTPAKKPQDD